MTTATSLLRGSRGFATATQPQLIPSQASVSPQRSRPAVASMTTASSPVSVATNGGTNRDDRPTPQATFDTLHKEFGFTLDAAASSANKKCERYFDAKTNGLAQSWAGETVWLNPPYGKPLPTWFAKAKLEAKTNGATVVMLVPASTDTGWWHDAMKGAAEVRFIQGRLSFGNSTGKPAPFGSALVIYRPGTPPELPRTTYGHSRH
jgi:phage N-6-adenine-methyltransferase